LLDFYWSLSEADTHFFTPWAFTTDAVAHHVAEAIAGNAISLVAADEHGRILGHAFIKHLRPGPQTGLLRKHPAKWLWRLAIGLIRKCLGRTAKPRLGIGVHSSARGTGLSRRLMQRLLDEARDRRTQTVALGVHKSNEKARVLYEKMGFRIVRELSQQRRKDSYEMELDLRRMNPTA